MRSEFQAVLKIRAIHPDPEAMTEYEKNVVNLQSWFVLAKLVKAF